ncbi:putative DNA-binding domain-containing protein (plasmid) [Burkholderia thailandensis]|uniref:HvfC/BufC N-terminal domain-containing protein n=1 Tax=Burkholderia thailandensis TaxID=57975 RepID=UPI00192D99A3|nr:DNA-binding domain-containing protein [Burkholderia thailandensis]MBS2132263.1 putative DNA-binding domain-containing protein [Burkholderia thailandensis]QRA15354.1 putative DNA-binding domain-containing protein [Burkholderia thailandensis]
MNMPSPTLAELQSAVLRQMSSGDEAAVAWVVPDGLGPGARLGIYRNTATSVLVNALRLAFPAVQRLVGAEFFDSAATLFCRWALPRSAWLDEYGAQFPAFLAGMPQTAMVPYLVDVAGLEWQVNGVLHAPDAPLLDLARLNDLDEAALGRLQLRSHPAARLLRCQYPADLIWRAVLEQDDRALRAIRLDDGPAHLLVQRTDAGVDVLRLGAGEWRIANAVFDGVPICSALARAPESDGYALVAGFLARGCFTSAECAAGAHAFNGDLPS